MAEEELIQVPGTFGDNGNFLIERELGRGGMGGVYMGRDKMLDRPVAVKVMLREYGSDAEFVEKFKKEAQAVARLIHPNIAQIYSYGICDGMPYMAMELAVGGSLYSIMNANPGKADIQRILKICQQVAQAVQCASDQGFVHGDIKPENILLDSNGNAKLVDFGLAAMQADTNEIWGTPYYISPEKVRKETVDFRADMYSLGCTLYHALTGIPPFDGDDSIAVVKKRFEGTPKRPSEIRSEITPAIDELVMTMMALEKGDRYPSFEALLKAFRDVLTSGLTQKLPAQPKSGAVPVRRMAATRGRRTMMTKRPGAPAGNVDIPDDPEISQQKDEEEDSGGLGAKIVLFVIGGLLAVGALVGGLSWYIYANNKAKEAALHRQIVSKMDEARQSIASTRTAAEKYDEKVREFAANALAECEKSTAELAGLLPDFASLLKPEPTKELLAAIALTNVVSETGAEASAAEGATVKAASDGEKKVAGGARKYATPQEEAKAYGIEVPEGEIDPASPEGEEFFKKLKEARLEAAKKAAEEKKAGAESKQDSVAESSESSKAPPPVIEDLHELWNRAYGCQAAQIKISLRIKKVLEACKEGEDVKDETLEAVNKLADISQKVSQLYNDVIGSPEVQTIEKGAAYIKSKGSKAIEMTRRRLREEELKRKRDEAKKAAEEAERKRLEELARQKAEQIQKETEEARTKFDALGASGMYRQLDWKGSIRQLTQMKENFQTTEGQLVADAQIRKVNAMKLVQDLFIKHLKDYVFKGTKLKGVKIISIDDKNIETLRADGKNKHKILWQKFYQDYPGNFNELINYVIINGKKNFSLNLKDWGNAMIGSALTMKIVCSQHNGAVEKSTQLAKQVYAGYDDEGFRKFLKETFPDIENFEDGEKED